MKRLIAIIIVAALAIAGAFQCCAAQRDGYRQIVYRTDLHCKNCANKITENVSFERGVRDLRTSVEEKTVTVVIDVAKTSPEKIQEAIVKLGYKAEIISNVEYSPKRKK